MVDASLPTGGNTALLNMDVFPDRLDASKLIFVYKVEMVDASVPPLVTPALLKVERFTLIVELT
jgi:hypothetical protein